MAKIRRPRYAQSAHLVQTVLFYDGPQIALFKSDRGYPMIGLAIDYDEIVYPMLMSEVSDRDYLNYLSQKVDLRYVFTEGSKRLYIADWDEIDNKRISLSRKFDIKDMETALPRSGFWARNHNVELKDGAMSPNAIASFLIDGTWDAPDFARLYSQFSDIYAFLAITSRKFIDSLSHTSQHAVMTAIRGLQWKGGGSYLSYYERIFSKVSEAIPLGVNRISYASPGTIELKGEESALKDVISVLNNFSLDNDSTYESYRNVDHLLSRFDLKTKSVDEAFFPNPDVDQLCKDLCNNILYSLGIDDPELVFNLTGQNTVLYCKMTLSYYRRAKRLYQFHVEGRIRGTDVKPIS